VQFDRRLIFGWISLDISDKSKKSKKYFEKSVDKKGEW
jgi:hypothetical protein